MKLKKIINNQSFKIFLFLFSIAIISSTIVFWVESRTGNPAIKSLFDGFWWTLVTITTVGYGDIVPVSTIGKIIGIITMFLGIALLSMVTGRIASLLVSQDLKKKQGLLKLKNISNHIIICGYANNLSDILEHYIKNFPSDIPLVLLNTSPPEKNSKIIEKFINRDIYYINGSHLDETTLKKARIETAQKVIILAESDENGNNAIEQDTKTVMSIITIKNINQKVYVAAQLLDIKYYSYFQNAKCDEIIIKNEIDKLILSYSIHSSGVFNIINEFLNKNNLIIENIPETLFHKPYSELKKYINHQYENTILIGLIENTGNFYQRKKEAINEAQKTADISMLVNNLQQVKLLKPNKPIFNPSDNYIIKKNSKFILLISNEKSE